MCVPTDRVAVLKDAVVTPADVLTLTGLPFGLPSTTNCTVPVGVPGAVLLIVAVKVTDCPVMDGFADEVNTVLLPALPTVWFKVAELLLAKLPSPL